MVCSKYFWNYVGLHKHYIRCHPLYKAHLCLLCGKHHDCHGTAITHAKTHKAYQMKKKAAASNAIEDSTEPSSVLNELTFVKTEVEFDDYNDEDTQFCETDLMLQEQDEEQEEYEDELAEEAEEIIEEYLDEEFIESSSKTPCKEEVTEEISTTTMKEVDKVT